MDLKVAVGHRIKAIRLQRGMTQLGLADQTDRAVESIGAFERGSSAPSFETLERLGRALDVPVRDLFDFGDDKDDIRPERLQAMNTILDAVRRLDDDRLDVAAALVETLAGQGGRLADGANTPRPAEETLADAMARNLRHMREERGWTRLELARRAGLHGRQIDKFEGKRSSVSLHMIERLSKALDVDPAELLYKDTAP